VSFLSPAWWGNGVILGVVGILREWLVGNIYGHLVNFLRWRRRRDRRKVIPEDGWIDGRKEFIGKKGGGMDGGGR